MEEWKPIQGFPKYAINQKGEIKHIIKDKYISLNGRNKDGYVQVYLFSDSQTKHTKFPHRLVAEHFLLNPDNLPYVDHIDRKRTNNNISNLRWADALLNGHNRTKRHNTIFKYIGLSYAIRPKGHIRASIKYKGKSIHLGTFETEEEAARAYDVKAKELYGETARLNFP